MSYSKDSLKQMAKSAAQKYVSAEKPMNETISKIAKERDLNEHQIKRVSEFANHIVNAKLAKKTSYTDFDLADPDKITSEKTASFTGAYLGMGESESMSKTASHSMAGAIENSSVPVLVFFGGEWSDASRIFNPTLKRTIENRNDLRFIEIDVDENKELAQRYNVRSVPSVKLIVNGKVEDEFEGVMSPDSIKEWLDKNVPSGGKVAKVALKNGDYLGDELVKKIAEKYDVEYNFSKIAHSSQPVYRILKFAHEVIEKTADEMYHAKMAVMENEKNLFEDIKEALLSGVPIEQVAKDLEKVDQLSALKKVWPRLEAEGLVQESHYEQGGPYSDIRRLKKAAQISKEAEYMSMAYDFEIGEDAPMLKKASRFSELDQQFEEAYRSLGYVHKYACSFSDVDRTESEQRRVEKVADRIDKKIASSFSKLKSLGRLGRRKANKAFKPMKDVAKASTDVAKGVGNVGKNIGGKAWKGAKGVGKSFNKKDGIVNSKNIGRAGTAAGLAGAGYAATKNKFKENKQKPGA